MDHTLYLMLADLHEKTDRNTEEILRVREAITTLVDALTEEQPINTRPKATIKQRTPEE